MRPNYYRRKNVVFCFIVDTNRAVQSHFIGYTSGSHCGCGQESKTAAASGFQCSRILLEMGSQKVVTAKLDIFFPASGNYNGTSLNNRGSNGNYWSSSYISETNAYNLNFNSGGVNPANNNNRRYGFSVRAVQQSLCAAHQVSR